MKFIQIRHWDYWFHYYDIGDYKYKELDGVEFCITNDYKGDDFVFYFDVYNMNALEYMIGQDEFIEKEDKEYDYFINRYQEMKNNKIKYFIGSLYYESYSPNIKLCNFELKDNKTILDLKSPNYSPHCAVIFINDRHPVSLDVLYEWVGNIYKSLFKEDSEFKVVNIPTYEQVLKEYND